MNTADRRLLMLAPIPATAYLLTIIGANWAIGHLGTPPQFPGAPHTIAVGFGYHAPSGVMFVAAALVLRDLTQLCLGRKAGEAPQWWQVGIMLELIALGAGLSALVATPAIAGASAAAFALSELVDFALFTWVAPRWTRAVLLGGLAGAVVDSLVFLQLAFHSLQFWQGQMLGKAYGILIATVVIGLYRSRRWYRVRSYA